MLCGARFRWIPILMAAAVLVVGAAASSSGEEDLEPMVEEAVYEPQVALELEALPTEDEPEEVLPDGQDAKSVAEAASKAPRASAAKQRRRVEVTGEQLWELLNPWEGQGIQVHRGNRPAAPRPAGEEESDIRVHAGDEGEEGIIVH